MLRDALLDTIFPFPKVLYISGKAVGESPVDVSVQPSFQPSIVVLDDGYIGATNRQTANADAIPPVEGLRCFTVEGLPAVDLERNRAEPRTSTFANRLRVRSIN